MHMKFGMRDDAVAYSQAAFRWVLQNPSVSCLVVSFTKVEQCDEYLFASGTPVKQSDLALLHRYDNLASADYCRPHCGTCLDTCPVGLPIDMLWYPKDALRVGVQQRIREGDPYFSMLRQRWGGGLRRVFGELPDPDWLE